MECEPKSEAPGSPDRDGGADRETGPDGGIEGMADCETLKGGIEETDDGKKRKRKPYRPGHCAALFFKSCISVLYCESMIVNQEIFHL